MKPTVFISMQANRLNSEVSKLIKAMGTEDVKNTPEIQAVHKKVMVCHARLEAGNNTAAMMKRVFPDRDRFPAEIETSIASSVDEAIKAIEELRLSRLN